MQSLTQSLLCIFNLLVDQQLLEKLCQRSNYSTLISNLINNLYQLIVHYFFRPGDENLISTPKTNIEYSSNCTTNDLLFSTSTFETMLKLRFIITNGGGGGGGESGGGGGGGGGEAMIERVNSEANNLSSVSSSTHRFLQFHSHFFRHKLPFQMRDLIEKIYIGLCRLPVIDRFIRVPDVLWRTVGFRLDYKQFLKNDTSTLPPLEYLRDPNILKEHLKHILAVGWTTRNQFEYEYVNMLTLLHNLSDDYYLPMSSNSRSPVCTSIIIFI